MPTTFVAVPTDEALSKRATWTKGGKNEYLAVRSHLMIVESPGVDAKRGPVVEALDFPAGSEVTATFTISQSAKLTEEVSSTLESTVATKLNHEVTTALKTGVTAKTPGLESSFQTEVQSRIGIEFTESLREGLAQMRRIEIATAIEDTTTVKLTLKDDARVVKHLMLLPTHWDVYLVGAEAIALEWGRHWTRARVRKTLQTASDNTRRPLFRLTLYEPQPTTSLHVGSYEPDLNEKTFVEISPLDGKVPRRKIPELASLKDLSRDAFPTTPEAIKDFVIGKKKKAAAAQKTSARKQLTAGKATGRKSSSRASAPARSAKRADARTGKNRPSSSKSKI